MNTSNIGKSNGGNGAQQAALPEPPAPTLSQSAKAKTDPTEKIAPEVRQLVSDTPLVDRQDEISRLARLPEEEQQAVAEKIAAGEAKSVKEARRVIRREEAMVLPDNLPTVSERYQLILGDFTQVAQELAPGNVDVIITDPPYSREHLPLYEMLARHASRLLKPGGSLLVMAGQSYLPEIFALMTPHLTYHWTVAYLTPGGQAPQIWQRRVNTFWKPVLWFTNGEYDGQWVGDVAKSAVNDNDKRFHDWGQSESGMAGLIERFSCPGDTVLDPFCGGGTIGSVALAMNRRFIGIDISEGAIKTARARIVSRLNEG